MARRFTGYCFSYREFQEFFGIDSDVSVHEMKQYINRERYHDGIHAGDFLRPRIPASVTKNVEFFEALKNTHCIEMHNIYTGWPDKFQSDKTITDSGGTYIIIGVPYSTLHIDLFSMCREVVLGPKPELPKVSGKIVDTYTVKLENLKVR